MPLKLYYHPFSSFCQKATVALREREVPFEGVIVDLGDPDQRAALEALWPMAKFPVLRDEEASVTIPEASLIVEYVDRHPAAAGAPLIPDDPGEARIVHLWDRVFDNYVEHPMQKAVADNFRPEGSRDPHGVEEAEGPAPARLRANRLRAGEEWSGLDRRRRLQPRRLRRGPRPLLCEHRHPVRGFSEARRLLRAPPRPPQLRPRDRGGAALSRLPAARLARRILISSGDKGGAPPPTHLRRGS
jgi:glutathione S-transferase